MHAEIVTNDYMHEISTGTISSADHQLAAPSSTICVTTANGGQVYEAQTGNNGATVHLIHDATQAIPQQVVETTTTELTAAAAILSVAGAQAFQQVMRCSIDEWID